MKKKADIFANELMERLNEMPLSQISVIDFCEKLGTSRQNFYYYYKSIEECLVYLMLREHPINSNLTRPFDSINTVKKFIVEHPAVAKNLVKDIKSRFLVINFYFEYFKNSISKYVDYCMQIDFKLNDTEKNIVVRHFTYEYLAYILEYIKNPDKVDIFDSLSMFEFMARNSIEEYSIKLRRYNDILAEANEQ